MKTNEQVVIVIRATPAIADERELRTILQSSLHALWGDLCVFEFDVHRDDGTFSICCSNTTAAPLRAALTWPTPPPYLQDTAYRFDVLSTTAIMTRSLIFAVPAV